MLPAAHRLTEGRVFRETIRRGRRASSRLLVLHVSEPGEVPGAGPAQVGFVVSKAVGNAVVRNRVRRRLRHGCVPWLAELRPGAVVVVRALPASADASWGELERHLARVWARAVGTPGVEKSSHEVSA